MKSEIIFVVIALAVIGTVMVYSIPRQPPRTPPAVSVKAFSSENEFRSYIQDSMAESSYGYYAGLGMAGSRSMITLDQGMSLEDSGIPAPSDSKAGGEPSRVSETNVQVMGIDEPDIVKTDGSHIYFSSSTYYPLALADEGRMIYPYYGVAVLEAFPPERLNQTSFIREQGDLLLYNDILAVFSSYSSSITGYDVSTPKSPEKKWTVELNGSIVTSRLYQGKIYLVTRQYVNYNHPCPIVPLTKDGIPVVIECGRIFHPSSPAEVDVTYNAMILNPEDGNVEKAVSFVGSYSSSIVYMSESAIYITYQQPADFVGIFSDFLKGRCADLIPLSITEKIDRIRGYDISPQSKMTELSIILTQYMASLSQDESLRLQNEISNRMVNYTAERKRELGMTGILKIGMGLEMLGSGSVPGTLLNQFSMDEYQGHLRVAVTVGGWGWTGSTQTANDVYVLDRDMKITGSVKDLGLTEQIYSVRFMHDRGYMVTFRQIDPFYILDLSDPANPRMRGELKIPGYSSYLHQISGDEVLGIGKEGSQVKISLFDVSSADDPREKSKYLLAEYWSDILNTHHAFLLDDKHGIFFLPGSKGGYVFSYEGGEISMKKAVSGISARRAVYIEDYLYIIGDNKIVVLDENTWEKANELAFS